MNNDRTQHVTHNTWHIANIRQKKIKQHIKYTFFCSFLFILFFQLSCFIPVFLFEFSLYHSFHFTQFFSFILFSVHYCTATALLESTLWSRDSRLPRTSCSSNCCGELYRLWMCECVQAKQKWPSCYPHNWYGKSMIQNWGVRRKFPLVLSWYKFKIQIN